MGDSPHANVDLVLNRLCTAYGEKQSTLAVTRILNANINTVNGWKFRGRIPYDVIRERCPDISWDWLMYGIEPYFVRDREISGDKVIEVPDRIKHLEGEINLLNRQIDVLLETVERLQSGEQYRSSYHAITTAAAGIIADKNVRYKRSDKD